jgi:hypothetical protein
MRVGTGAVRLAPGGRITSTPRFVVSGSLVIAGPYTSGEEHEMHLLATRGAGNWQDSAEDEFRFDTVDGLLKSLLLQVPSGTTTTDEDCGGWSLVPYEVTGMQLIQEQGFSVPPCTTSLITSTGGKLLCTTGHSPAPGPGSRRLRVCPDLDLLFSESSYLGWILSNPVVYMSSGWETGESDDLDAELAVFLVEYLTLGDGSVGDALEEGDTATADALRSLMERIRVDCGAVEGRLSLRNCIAEVLDWYS